MRAAAQSVTMLDDVRDKDRSTGPISQGNKRDVRVPTYQFEGEIWE